MVIEKEINWISQEALEAVVIITDGQFELLCFSHPFRKKKGDLISEPLHALDPSEVLRLDFPSLRLERLNSAFGYLIEGKLIDKESGRIGLGDIAIEIDSHFIPRDLKNNENVSFKCDRLDIY